MKRLIVAFLLVLLTRCANAVEVNGVPAAGPNPAPVVLATPSPVGPLKDGLHLLDNIMPSGCRDVVNGTWMGCTGEAIYKQYYLSADTIFAIPIGGKGFWAPGLRVYAGQILMEQVPAIKNLATNNVVLTSALNYLTAGGFYTRDFNQGINRAGYYLGLLVKFGA